MRFLGILLLSSCIHQPVTPHTVDPREVLDRAAKVLHLIKDILPPEACISAETIASALDIGVRASDKQTLPDIDLDITSCIYTIVSSIEGSGYDNYVDATLASALLAINELPDSCEKVWALSAVSYARGAYPEVMAEILAPDGIIHVPGVTVPTCNQ